METKEKRNRQLYKDFKSGKFTNAELIGKYKVSQKRLYEIVKREAERLG